MQINNKKIISLVITGIFLGFFAAPAALAAECDQDGDGYIVIPATVLKIVSPQTPYTDNGNYNPAEWQSYFNMFKTAQLTEQEQCDGMNFKKGAEPKRCDSPVVGPSSNVYDPAKQIAPLQGSSVNPGSLDIADNGIDEDCNGKDASLLATTGTTKDVSGLAGKVMSLLSKAVIFVSVVIMIYGGFMYATAAGDEGKTSKARKAIIGAVIGLLVGLLAPTVVNFIAANLG